ncbi:MAG: hypothetical protein ACK48W_01225 [Bacteroidota bacterium]|jgi:hypothetical protein
MINKVIVTILILLNTVLLYGQNDRKINFVGGARSLLNANTISVSDSLPDTVSVKKNNGGYAIMDMGLLIKPNKNTEIMGMFRIRNEFGGFWGSGVSFDVRQLWLKGVVANALRYQLGDINLKQTPFTLYNHHADQIDSLPAIFDLQRNIVSYDRFYTKNNSWRMQGANVDFGLNFSKIIKELNFSGLITRLNATNFSNIPDRLMAGGSVNVVQSKYFEIAYNVNSVFDVKGTILDSNIFKNTVSTFDWKIKKEISGNLISLGGEAGTSKHYFSADTLAPNLSDYFVNAFAKYYITKWKVTFTAGYLNVGPDFRSIGAQSKDVNYNGLPTFFNRYTNAQDIRPITLFDVIGNENIYNRTVTQNMMPISTVFNNVLPFGIATNNRIGGYARVQFKTKNQIAVNAEYFNLNEIRGQGSFALKKFEVYKAYVLVPINKLIKHSKHISIQFGTTIQNTKRNSSESIENIKLESMQINGGFRWEIFKNFDLLGGYISQNTKGNEFSADRNTYNEITYFNIANYNLNQQILAGGIRYNFGVNTHLTLLYQSNKYQDKLGNNASFEIKQFGIIYSITL